MSWFVISCIVLFVSPAQEVAAAKAEYVRVLHVLDMDNKVIVQRQNGEEYILEYGTGCLSMWRFDGKPIIVNYTTSFGGIGSGIILPNDSGSCRVWTATPISESSLPSSAPVVEAPVVSTVRVRSAVFTIGSTAYAVADGPVSITTGLYVNPNRDIHTYEMDVQPFTQNGRTYLPVRFLAYSMGIPDQGVKWSSADQRVTLAGLGAEVSMTVDVPTITVTGKGTAIDTAPVMKEGRVFLPARYVAEAYGYQVSWKPEANQVFLSRVFQ